MTETEKREFWALLQGVYEFYRCRSDLSDFAASVWWNACRSYSVEQVSKAFSSHLVDPKSGQFLPKPADIVRALSGTQEDRSLMAWGKLFDAMRQVGQYRSVAFDDPMIHAVVTDMGGWPKLCQITEQEVPFVQRRFCETHAAYARAGCDHYPRMLAGVHDIQNGAHGYGDSKPILIGDAEKAKSVLENGSSTGKTKFTLLSDAIANMPMLEGAKK
jgi:hypothetical protein